MDKSSSIKSIAAALCKAQAAMGGAQKGNENPFFKSKYADLGSVIKAIKQPFADNGLSFVQFPVEKDGRIGVETIIMHESGEWLLGVFTVALTKQDAQGAGSAITYCRRYGLQAAAGIPSEDDDGNYATKTQKAGPILISGTVSDILKHLNGPNSWQWVQDNFRGCLAKEWNNLPAQATVRINELYSQTNG